MRPPAPIDGRSTTGAVARTALVLRRLASHADPVGVSKLSREIALPKSTLHRILALLEGCGAIVRRGTRYCLSDNWVEPFRPSMGHEHLALVRLLTPHVVELHIRTGMIACLAVRRGLEVEMLLSLYGHNDTAIMLTQSPRRPVHASAAGLLLLALEPDGATLLCGEPPPPSAGSDCINVLALRRQMAGIRGADMAIHHHRATGMVEVAVPVRLSSGRSAAALAVRGPRVRFDIDYVATILRQTARTGTLALRRRA